MGWPERAKSHNGNDAMDEQHVLNYINTREDALLQFLRDLVATPSPTPPGDERAVAARIQQELASLQLGEAQIIAAQPERPNLLLKIKGAHPGPTLVLNGHTDTKPMGNREEWTHDPYDPVIKDGKLFGLGSTDMKGAVAAMVYATAAVAQVTGEMKGELHLLASADEEGGSELGARYLAAGGHIAADAILIGEPSGVRHELECIALDSRGICCFRIRVHGDQMHSSLSDEFAATNASVKAAELICRLAHDFKQPGATMNAGVTLEGGVFFGVVPGLAEFGCDLRVPPGSTREQTHAELESWLKQQLRQDPDLRAELVWESVPSTWIEPVSFPHEHPLVAALQAACGEVLPQVPPIGCFPAATDAPWFVSAGIPTIPAFGPGLLPLAHSPDECVEVSSIFACARIYALAALNYLT
jgi:acetylornithine deacetylase/succinyl-diaminopimelate desuccinylase family protein